MTDQITLHDASVIDLDPVSFGQSVEPDSRLQQVEGLATVLRVLGTSRFYASLIGWLETIIPNDFWFVADYQRGAKPVILQDTWQKSEAKSFYFSNVCQFDPVFHALGNQTMMPGVSISMIRNQIDPRYADYLERVAHIADELIILVPNREKACTAICLDREDRRFSVDEVYSARRIARLLAEIMELHWNRLPTATGASSQDALASFGAGKHPANFTIRLKSLCEMHGLTRQESQIVKLSLSGYPNMAIAKELGITKGAVRNHKVRLYRKLDITTERELVPLFLV
jgi:DNA-binding CsgD family transcriptional regulator